MDQGDLLLGQPHVEARVDVQLQLGLGAQGDERGDGHERLLLLGQARAGVDVAKSEGDDVVGQLRVKAPVGLHELDVVEGVGVPGGHEFHHAVQAALVAICSHLRSPRLLSSVLRVPGQHRVDPHDERVELCHVGAQEFRCLVVGTSPSSVIKPGSN